MWPRFCLWSPSCCWCAVERRRRDKINNWIVTLSKIIPDCDIDGTKTGAVSCVMRFSPKWKSNLTILTCYYALKVHLSKVQCMFFFCSSRVKVGSCQRRVITLESWSSITRGCRRAWEEQRECRWTMSCSDSRYEPLTASVASWAAIRHWPCL